MIVKLAYSNCMMMFITLNTIIENINTYNLRESKRGRFSEFFRIERPNLLCSIVWPRPRAMRDDDWEKRKEW